MKVLATYKFWSWVVLGEWLTKLDFLKNMKLRETIATATQIAYLLYKRVLGRYINHLCVDSLILTDTITQICHRVFLTMNNFSPNLGRHF